MKCKCCKITFTYLLIMLKNISRKMYETFQKKIISVLTILRKLAVYNICLLVIIFLFIDKDKGCIAKNKNCKVRPTIP